MLHCMVKVNFMARMTPAGRYWSSKSVLFHRTPYLFHFCILIFLFSLYGLPENQAIYDHFYSHWETR